MRIDTQKCTGRMKCLRACPTQALRVRGEKATLMSDRCIDCGECVRVCPNHAFIPQTSSFSDFSGFKYTIALQSPVFYSQFGKDVRPSAILAALKKIGFHDAYDVTCASESVSIAGFGIYAGDLHFYSDEWDAGLVAHEIDVARCPVVLLTGEYDYSASPEATGRLAKLIPGARVKIMPKLGHFPMTENPDGFRAYLIPVLEELAKKLQD